MAKSRAPHWQFSDQECLALGQASANVVRHFPVDFERAGVLIDGAMFVAVAGSVVMPRVERDQALRAEAEARAAQEAAAREAARFGAQTAMEAAA